VLGRTDLIHLPALSALMAQILELLGEGQLSKRVVRKLIALLLEKRYPLPSELITMINSDDVPFDFDVPQ